MNNFFRHKDTRWLFIWLGTSVILAIWNVLFLNKPALKLVVSGFVTTFVIALLVVLFTLVAGWMVALLLNSLAGKKNRVLYLFVTFLLNLIRSIPQIVGILFVYIGITVMVQSGIVKAQALVFILMASGISLFIFLELVDLIRDRIDHFKNCDFYNAMRVSGIPDSRVINFDILWKNSRVHIFNKLIAVFGYAIFLQCSVDFIISVGLSSDVNDVSLPTTLGSLLANIDSKQDILAIGYTITNPGYIGHLFLEHLQGLTVAFLIVFTLTSVYHIANGYAERHRL